MIKNLPLRLAEVGKIKIGRKGEKRTTAGGKNFNLPEKVDYFIVTTMERDGDNFRVDEPLMKILDSRNSKPRQLKIALPYDNIDLNFFTEYGLYVGRKRLCFGDGEKATRIYLDKETKKEDYREEVKCPCECLESGKCKAHGILSAILRDNFKLGGVYQFRTTSINSIMNIMSGLTQIQQMTQGILAMVPLVMSLQPQTVVDKDNHIRTIYAVNITADVSEWKQLLETAKEISMIRANAAISIRSMEDRVRNVMLLKRDNSIPDEDEPDDEGGIYTPINHENSPELQADINEEFSPQTVFEEGLPETEGNGLPWETQPKTEKKKMPAFAGTYLRPEDRQAADRPELAEVDDDGNGQNGKPISLF